MPCYIPPMAKPPVFDRDTWQRQKDLLAGAERQEQAKREWSLFGHGVMLVIGAVLLLGSFVGLVVSFFR